MIIVDTSIWIDHFRELDAALTNLIRRKAAAMHSYVLGELVMGNLHQRHQTVAGLRSLPRIAAVAEDDLIAFVDDQNLSSSGLGFVDAHLLAAALRKPGTRLWTRDRRLAERAKALRIAWRPD